MTSLDANEYTGNHLKISQSTGRPNATVFAGVDQLLLVLPAKVPVALWRQIPQGSRLKELAERREPASVPAICSRLDNKRQTAIHVGHAAANDEPFKRLTFARKLLAAALQEKAGTLGIWVLGFDAGEQLQLTGDILSAALAGGFALPAFKEKKAPERIRSIRLIGLEQKMELGRIKAEARGNNLARSLTALPPNKLDAKEYVSLLRKIAKGNNWGFRKYSVANLKKMGAGAFLAVAQGNADDSAAIVCLRYRPGKGRKDRSKKQATTLSLVGKGIIFDTGGTNLKPFTSMLDMHIDMGGSAVAVGTLQALTELEVSFDIDCWLAITENRTGPTAYKSQDVVTAANGKTIQTIHTDAEGRMALADTLVFACRDQPDFILDYATLTGACVTAITTRYSGVFTNHPDLHPVLKRSGRDSGERVWPFPVGKEFLEDLKSDTADIMQCSANGGGDHILAASFLNEFVDATIPWVHVDLSACQRKGGLAHIPTEITGFGVRFSLDLILDKGVLDKNNWQRQTEEDQS
jgi:leucyl aminopeptidase